jgi:hypothetical protein
MLMDTFYTVIQYRYNSELISDKGGKQIRFLTKLSISYDIQFVKMNPFKSRVEGEGLKDNEKAIKEFWLPRIKSTALLRSKYYYDGKPIETAQLPASVLEKPVLEEKEHKETKVQNKFFQTIINKYSIGLIVVFLVLLLSKFKFNSSLLVAALIGMGILLVKLDEINNRLAVLESRRN